MTTTTYLSADAFGIDPYLAYFGDNDENEVGYMTIYPVFDKVRSPAKSVEVTFAIDTKRCAWHLREWSDLSELEMG